MSVGYLAYQLYLKPEMSDSPDKNHRILVPILILFKDHKHIYRILHPWQPSTEQQNVQQLTQKTFICLICCSQRYLKRNDTDLSGWQAQHAFTSSL